jgi:RHS repeat-associated protein
LIQVNNGATTAYYTYNGNGQRVKKSVSGTVTVFHYSLSGQIIAESNSAGTITAEYVYLNGQPLAKIEGANTYYYHNDHLATPQKMTDSTGTVVWSADYKPFGEAAIDNQVTTITNNLRFPGQYYDAETGLNYNYYRDYNPAIGKYIEADPIGLSGGPNLYSYVNQAPTKRTDFFGLLFSDQAFLHYLEGTGTDLNMGFDEIDTSSVRPSQFPQVAGELRGGCTSRTVEIDDTMPFNAPGDAHYTVGDITLHLVGSLKICNCSWTFTGKLSSFDDLYNMNQSTHRSRWGEALTTFGRTMGRLFNARRYTIHIIGSKSINESGRL